MAPALPLGLRNRLAELILDAFDDAEARETVAALAAFCAASDGAVGDDAASRLAGLGWFESAGPGRVRLRGAHRANRDALCRRARAGATVVAGRGPERPATTLAGLLARAARLADAGLHFEVHELLEPAWLRAEGVERVGLQGLIQVAVAFHHDSHDNRAGAIALLTDGLDRVEAAAAALPVETGDFCRDLHTVLAAWRAGGPAPPAPAWPAPGTMARRSG